MRRPTPRTYTKVRRAAAEEATRERIVSAMIALHEEVGPARTTVSAVAQRAGVERLTVYRHFPDEPSMLRACSAHWNALHPPPAICPPTGDPLADVRRTLLRLYDWYRTNAAMLIRIATDARQMPVVAALIAPFDDYLDQMAAELDERWPRRSARRAQTIRHALELSTWGSLDRITGSDRRAAALAVSWLRGRAEIGNQKAEVRKQKSESRSQKAEVRKQKSESRKQKAESRSQKSETRN